VVLINGELAKAQLSRIYHPTLALNLNNEAAASWNTMRLRALELDHVDLYPEGPLGAYRDYAGQVFVRRQWCERGACQNAAVPGTSNHGLGRAVDSLDATMWSWIDRYGSAFGWHHWDAAWERWHREYDGGFNRPNPGISSEYPVLAFGSGGPGQDTFVKEVQRRLRRHRQKVSSVDGEFLWETKRALVAFQRTRSLKPNGVVNPLTWRALRS
jgi:hypothetical protein